MPDSRVPSSGERSGDGQRPQSVPWRKIAVVFGGVTVGAAAGAIITLAATHKSAVTENAIAYVNGIVDGYAKGFVDGYENALVGGSQDAVY